MNDVVVIDTGTANLASIMAALQRLSVGAVVSRELEQIRSAQRLVLPGVGSFESGMRRLREIGITSEIADRVADDRPLLAVCLGLQLLCRDSEESPGVTGLAVVDAAIERFRDAPIVPQLGWNVVEAETCELVETGYAYYANSYRLADPPTGWRTAHTTHGERFVAAMEHGKVLACQFHPELSGAWGQALLSRWLERGAAC